MSNCTSIIFPAEFAERLSPFCWNGVPAMAMKDGDDEWDRQIRILTPCSSSTSKDSDIHLVFIGMSTSESRSGLVCQPNYSISKRRISGISSPSGPFQLQSISSNASQVPDHGISPIGLSHLIAADVNDDVITIIKNFDDTEGDSSYSTSGGYWVSLLDIPSNATGSDILREPFQRSFDL